MNIQSYGRYGDSQTAEGAVAVEKLIRDRVDELCDEQFSRADFEHSQISVTNSQGWTITAYLAGRIDLYRIEDEFPERKLYDLPPEELVTLFLDLAGGDMKKVLSRKWNAATTRYYYLHADRPNTPDLFRAISAGDEKWVKAELAFGVDVNHLDTHFGRPLQYAALCGRIGICRVLLEAGADPTAVDQHSETPADYARGADEYLHNEEAVAELVALLEQAAKKV